MLSILIELTLQKELHKTISQITYFGQKVKTQQKTTTKQKRKHVNPCQSQESKPGTLHRSLMRYT